MHHIPNILTSFRILLVPLLVHQVLIGAMSSAAVILIVSGLTDLLDGFLARRFGWVSRLGKLLDPVADKLTQITVYVLFAITFAAQFWFFFAFLIFRELLMLALGGYLLKKGVKLEGSRWFGKVTTALFYASMVSIALFPYLPLGVIYVLLAAISVFALITLLSYIPEFRSYKREAETMTGQGES